MKRLLIVALALSLTLLSLACTAPAETLSPESAQELLAAYETNQTAPTPTVYDAVAPLSVIRGIQSFENGYMIYPKVLYIDHAETINAAIREEIALRSAGVDCPVFTSYRVEYNRNGLFSFRIDLYDLYSEDEESLDQIYMTIDALTGQQCSMGDLFDQEDDRWRGVLPDIVMDMAETEGLTLLSQVMSINDGQQFYVTGDEVVLVYELYEISTWSAGQPEFRIPMEQLAEFIPADSPLYALLGDGNDMRAAEQ